MDFDFVVILDHDKNSERTLDIPDYFKEEDTYISQIHNFVSKNEGIPYDDIKMKILRGKRMIKVNENTEIQDGDTIYVDVVETSKNTPVNIKTGTSMRERKMISNKHSTQVDPPNERHNDIYEGATKDGKRHGVGILTNHNGYSYQGEFKDGEFDGYGVYTDKHSTYFGDWKEGNKDGFGIEVFEEAVNNFPVGEYEGEFKNGRASGTGRFTDKFNNVYIGEWNGKMEDHILGLVEITYVNGDVYKGGISSLLSRHDFGIMEYSNGSIYDGDWKNNKWNGYGEYKDIDGKTYNGFWRDNLKFGTFKVTDDTSRFVEYYDDVEYTPEIYKIDDETYEVHYKNGIYIGELKSGVRNGKGTMKYFTSNEYTGDWQDGRICGQGKMKYFIKQNKPRIRGGLKTNTNLDGGPNWSAIFTKALNVLRPVEYEGKWKDDEYVIGKVVYNNGDMYEGNFDFHNRRKGQGRYVASNGIIFEGEFSNNEPKNCTITYTNGDIYRGESRGFLKFGKGVMIYRNGDVYDGNWSVDQKARSGKMMYANGDYYDGDWFYDKRSQHGKMVYANGDCYEGMWKKGMKHGFGKMTYANGEHKEGEWRDDRRMN